ncbi:HAD superfamily P-type ATPase [Paramagnetospirillum caucaseum]|uniref:HAD superfamily P-type ATPase n=1 Tax=Paramagnetospirillum caucaseum TaxID=1244869 RepID=M2Z8R0_9PROT|nr:cation-transporting P-type ATPase [Paramagnetospirillum caucaseum]EME70710.1 HAD superfamily P-type ATPase [Paramagnetospirillum caucaseum]
MRIQDLPVDAVYDALVTGPEGLSAAEAARRLAEYGINQVERIAPESLPLRFARQFTHLFAVVLWLAAALAFFAETFQPGQGMGTLGIAIILVIAINGSFSFFQEYRSERALESLILLLPLKIKARRGGELVEVPATQLVPGDVVVLEEGNAVPADCRVVRSMGVQVNLASITGESVPVVRDADADPHAELGAARNVLPAGADIAAGEAEAVVFATGMRTMLGAIAHLTQTAGQQASPLQKEVLRLSRIITVLAMGSGVAFFAIGMSGGMDIWHASIFAIGLMVANVPEGLLPTVTLALAMASRRLARKNVLVRKLTGVETLGSATVICTDKTGTLTENRMRARQVFMAGRLMEADAVADAGLAGKLALETAALCQTLDVVDRQLVGDPTEIALVELAGGMPAGEPLDGISFDSTRRRMALLYAGESGAVLHVKGALEALLPLCGRVADSDGVRSIAETDRKALLQAEIDMAEAGMRVLALARREMAPGTAKELWEQDLVLLGLIGLQDPPRPEVPDAVARCRGAGIKVIMVTGDHPRTAEAVARQVGLVTRRHPRIIVGDHLQRMSKTQLQLALDAPEIIFARTRADQKWRIVDALQAKGEVVAVTGDGVNDAPALKQADIGIAMGASGTDVARQAADMVLLDDNFASIVAAIEEGRAVFDNIRKFLTYILTSNIPEMVPYLLFAVFNVPLALTVVQILAIDLGTDMVPALALAVERPRAGVMTRPPRARGERLIDSALLARAYGFLGPLQAAGAMAAFFLVLTGGGWSWGRELPVDSALYLRATTACLATVVVMQMANLFACRSHDLSAFRPSPGTNRLIPAGLIFEGALIAALVYSPLGNTLFATVPLAAADWLRAGLFAALLLLAEEARKLVIRLSPRDAPLPK